MNNVYLTVGLQGAGKSTWSQKALKEGKITKVLNGGVSPERYPNGKLVPMGTFIGWLLKNGEDVCWDIVLHRAEDRIRIIKEIREEVPDAKIHAEVFLVPTDECRHRCHERDKNPIPDDLREKFIEEFEYPTEEEGFDDIELVTPLEGRRTKKRLHGYYDADKDKIREHRHHHGGEHT